MAYEPEERERQTPPKKTKKGKTVLMVLAIIAFCAAVTAIWWVVRKPVLRVEKTDHSVHFYFGTGSRREKTEKAETPQPSRAERNWKLPTAQTPRQSPRDFEWENGSLPQLCREVQTSLAVVLSGETPTGTAVLMSDDGYLVTTASAVEETAPSVRLWDGTVCRGEVIGRDSVADLAVLKIERKELTPAQFGESEALTAGQTLAVLNGSTHTENGCTVTAGILAGVCREQVTGGKTLTILETDGLLSAGSALLNSAGQVVGIGTETFSNEDGLGMAISVASLKPIVDELIEKGYVAGRPAIGVTVEALPLQAQIYYSLPDGAYVTAVAAGSDAEAKGLRRGDIITALDGEAVTGPESLRVLKDSHAAGDTVALMVFRDGEKQELSVVLMDRGAGE